jgi:3-deoxy-manno-octulosonate cytidylyltransferase (CMP-KDO synthetase)
MISWVIEGIQKSSKCTGILVATDDTEIAQVANGAGAEVAMTSPECPSGSDRIYEALQSREIAPSPGDIIVNIQGDEPLMDARTFEQVIEPLLAGESEVATLVTKFESLREVENPDRVKALLNQRGFCSYFSRYPIPFSRLNVEALEKQTDISSENLLEEMSVKKHVGIYAYTWRALQAFVKSPPSFWERAEGLEQLRFLEAGELIKGMITDYKGIGVDKPEDIKEVESLMFSQNKKGLL